MFSQYFSTGMPGGTRLVQDTPVEEEGPAAKDDHHWTRTDIEKMLQLYLTSWPQMGPRGKYDTLKELFTAIAHEINASLTSKQVQDKFNRLKKMHKKVKYEDQSGGRKFAYAKYFDQLETMDENFRKEMLTPSGGNSGNRGASKSDQSESSVAAPPFDAEQAAESAAAWQEHVPGQSPPGSTGRLGPGEEFYYLDCALSALRTRKLTPVEGIVLTMKQNSVASKRMLKAYQERTELLKATAEMERRQNDEHFKSDTSAQR